MCLKPAALMAIAIAVSGCAQQSTSVGLAPEARLAVQGKPMVRIAEPEPAPRRQIPRKGLPPGVGFFLPLPIGLVISAGMNIAEAAASNIDEVPLPDVAIAEQVEARLAPALAAALQTGPVASASVVDKKRAYGFDSSGIARMTTDAAIAGHRGLALDARTGDLAVWSSGKDLGLSTEEFFLAAAIDVRLVDISANRELGRVNCVRFEPMGTIDDVKSGGARLTDRLARTIAEVCADRTLKKLLTAPAG